MVRKKSLKQAPKTRNIEEIIRRTPPHLLREHNRKHLNINASTSTSHPIGNVSTNPIKTSTGNSDQFGYHGSSLPIQDHNMHTGIVPQEGETKRYLYLPMLLSIIAKTSTSSPNEAGTPRSSDTEHPGPSHGGSKSGGSNSRTTDYHPPYQLSSFYPVAPYTNGDDNWNHSQHQELAHLHCNESAREEQRPLPSYGSAHGTNINNINNTTSTKETSSSVLGKRPAASFFQQPPTQQPLGTPDMRPECTDELFSLVQSVGTPEFIPSWDKVFRSGSSMYGPPHHTSSTHAMAGSSGTSSEPNLTLGLGNDSTFDKGKGKDVQSYCELSVTSEMRESMKKQKKRTDLSKLTLGLDRHGCSKNAE